MWTERTEMLLGADAVSALEKATVAVIGCGGVGGYAAEMLGRAGVGRLIIVDNDVVSESNINRQILALTSTVGREKSAVLAERLRDINPSVQVVRISEYLNEENIPAILGLESVGRIDYLVDAIDTLSPKIALIQYCLANDIPMVSSMGSGAKVDVTKVRIADISKTYQCPLAHMLRKRLHKFDIRSGFLAVFSEEIPDRKSTVIEESRNKKSQVGTVPYLPAVFGCACAQAAIQHIASLK